MNLRGYSFCEIIIVKCPFVTFIGIYKILDLVLLRASETMVVQLFLVTKVLIQYMYLIIRIE